MSNPNAYLRFKKIHADTVALLPAATEAFKPEDSNAHLCRYALVLGVASMDSYFTRKFTNRLTTFLKMRGITPNLSNHMNQAKIDTEFFLQLLLDDTQRPFRKIHTKISGQLDHYTSQSVWKIDRLYSAFVLENLCDRAMKKVQKDGHLPGFRQPLKRLNRVVKRRHLIVHASDFNAHGKYYKIETGRTRDDLKLIYGFVTGAEAVIDEHFAKLTKKSK